jgi:stage II sporulation protein M
MMARTKTIKKENFFSVNYKLSWDYLKETKKFIFFIIGIFFFFSLIGFFVPVPEQIRQEILDIVKNLFEKTEGMNQLEMINFIFLNNLKSSFFGLFLGIFFGIFPILSSLINGYVLGFVALLSVEENGFSVLWKLLPHGIFELPAVFISLGMGLKFGTFLFKKNKKKKFFDIFFNSVRVFIFVVIPLLIIAAVIEGTLIIILG